MATLVFGAIGAGVGSFFGNWMLGWSIGTTIGGLLFGGSNGGHQDRGKLDDLRVSGSAYGAAIPRAWGYVRLAGNIIWSTDLVEHAHSQGGGGSGGGPSVTTYTYTVSCASLICEGPVASLKRIWFDRDVVWDSDDVSSSPIADNIVFYQGDDVQVADPTIYADITTKQGLPTPAFRGMCYIVFNDIDLGPYGNRIPNIEVELQATVSPTLADILSDLCDEVNISSSDYDFSAATQSVTGFMRPGRQSVRNSIEPLMQAFPGDLIEIDGKIKWVNRGGSKLYDIPTSDLAATVWNSGDADGTAPVEYTRSQEVELPTSIDVSYYTYHASDKTKRTYLQGEQNVARPTKNYLSNPQTITLPMSLTDAEAKQIAARNLYIAWSEKAKFGIVLPPKYLDLAPGDIVGVPVAGTIKRARVIDVEAAPIGPVGISLIEDDVYALDQSQVVAGGTGGTGGNQYVSIASITYHAWNGNALRDADIVEDLPGIYYGVSWPSGLSGCAVYISRDNGNSFQFLDNITDYTPIGTAQTVLPNFQDTAIFDTSGYVEATFPRGTPSSTGYWDLLAGGNGLLVGEEIVQYRDATLIDSVTNRWRFSNLLRGQRGTGYFASLHAISEKVVILSSTVKRSVFDTSVIGKQIILRFVPTGGTLASVTNFPVTVTGRELMPYAGVNLKGTRDGGSNLTVDWKRRTRKGGQWMDLNDASLGEDYERYDVEVWNSTYTILKRTTEVTEPLYVYTSAEQITDFGSNQSTVYLRIYQKNTVFGRGYKLEGSV